MHMRVAVDRLVTAARKLVGHFRHSVVASEELERKQTQMKIKEKYVNEDMQPEEARPNHATAPH